MSESLAAVAETQAETPVLDVDLAISPAWAGVLSLAMGVFGLVTAEFLPASLLTPIAADLGITNGAAGQTVTATAVVGTFAGIFMPILTRNLDRRLVMWSLTALLIASSLLAAFATNLPALLGARLLLGIGIGGFWSMMAAMAMRLVPERLLPRALSIVFTGVSVATVSAAPVGAYLGDLLGWRAVFFILSGIFACTAVALLRELAINPSTRPAQGIDQRSRGFVADYRLVLANPWARSVLFAAAIEAALMWGAFAYLGADLYLRFGLSFTLIGLIVATFGIGGLIYAAGVARLVGRFGQRGLAIFGGLLLGMAYLALAFAPAWWIAPPAVVAIGLGFYMLHNTLQTNATQMSPQARGTAVSIFSSALYLGQSLGVAGGSLLIDRAGAPAIFIVAALALPLLGVWFAAKLRKRN